MLSMFLSKTFRALAISDVPTIILPVTSITYQRKIHLTHSLQQSDQSIPEVKLSLHTRKTVEKAHGLPAKPIYPGSPYVCFVRYVLPYFMAEYPHLKASERIKIIAERWKALDDEEKEALSKTFQNDLVKYSAEVQEYNRTVTADERNMVEETSAKKQRSKLIKVYQKKASELNKPKRPPSSFLKFFHAQTDRRPRESYKDHMKRTAKRWNKLNKKQKQKYETSPLEMENWKKAMLEWEATVKELLANDDVRITVEDDEVDVDDEDSENLS